MKQNLEPRSWLTREGRFAGVVHAMRRFPAPEVSFADLMAVLIVVVMALIVFSKNMFIDNAVVFHDEYIYKVSSDALLAQYDVVGKQLGMRLPNHLFFDVYGVGAYFGANFYAFAQLLNVAFWAIGLLALYRLAVCSGLSRRRSLVYLVMVGLLPLSAYTKYFMPESMYFAMFCASLYALTYGVLAPLGHAKHAGLFLAGLLVGAMYFVKPHAIPLVMADVIFLAAFRHRVRNILVFGGGVLLAIVIGKALFSVPADHSPGGLGMYAQAVAPLLAKLGSYFSQPKVLAADLANVSTGHVLFLSAVFGLAFVVALATAVPRLRMMENGARVPEGTRLLSIYLLVASMVLVGMAIVFTLLVGESGRVHSRYYFFIFPVALLLLFHLPGVRMSSIGKVCGVLMVLISATWLFTRGLVFSEILPISLVSDSPEWGFVFHSKPLFYFVAVGLAVGGLIAVWRPRAVYLLIAVVGLASLVSNIDVAMKQKGLFRNSFVTGREALAVEEIVGRERMGASVVVGQNWDGLSKFLFHLQTAPSATSLAAGSNLQQVADNFPLAPFLIVISDGYEIPGGFACNADIPTVKICSVAK